MSTPPACYTTARVRTGRVLFAARHAQRLARDARRLGLGELDPADARGALERLAREALGAGEGIVRLEARPDDVGRIKLLGTTRGLDADPPLWRAVCARRRHPGPGPAPGAKLADDPTVEAARREARRAGADEALLFDAADRLVEGARSSILVVREDGGAVLPPLERGGVAGIARAVALEACAEIEERDVPRAELPRAREIVALNAVRGARPIVRLDGAAVGAALAGPWARRLAGILAGAGEL